MLGEAGLFALILVAVMSSVSVIAFAWQRLSGNDSAFSVTVVCRLNALLATFSIMVLAYLFLADQFQFGYVASHSNSALPTAFKLAAVWGGHEGSMLFWVFTLCLWAGLISFHPQHRSSYYQNVLWVMLGFSAAFSWFTVFASNPFHFNPVFVTEGRDLNPMLQDIGLIFHPPLLYLGYIGFSTVLAFALAALLEPKFRSDWTKACQLWAVSAWLLLTVGIMVGAWWAYNELGWGGWWFWDPVENASLLPWLTGTALLHTLLASSRSQQLKMTSLSLALVTFCLSILGTFIVRSGVLTSVHAFAVDPSKGLALLLILAVTLLLSFTLLLKQAEQIRSNTIRSIVSRSYLVLIASGLLVVVGATVFLGTFYPMLYELVGLGAISVGAPYFNTLLEPLAILALLAMGLVPFIRWHKGSEKPKGVIVGCFIVSLFCGVGLYRLQVTSINLSVAMIWGLSSWVIVTHCWLAFRIRTVTFMVFAHVGLAIMCVGAAMNAEHSYELNRKMEPGSQVSVPMSSGSVTAWTITYHDTVWYVGANYTAEQGVIGFESAQGDRFIVKPERRHYPVRVMNMSEPAIYSKWHGDYYVTLGPKVDSRSYAVKIQYKAYISWIWLGAIIAMLGATIPLFRAVPNPLKRVTHGIVSQS